jgi:hypothetical protein
VSTREEVLASLSPATRRYVEAVSSLTPLEGVGAYGTSTLDALELDPKQRRYVEGIMALTPDQLAAGFGTGPTAAASPTVAP